MLQPESTATERVTWLGRALLTGFGLVGVVVVAVAFGKPDSIKIDNGAANLELDFDGPDEPRLTQDDDDALPSCHSDFNSGPDDDSVPKRPRRR